MTTGKTKAFTRWKSNVSAFLNMLSRLVLVFLPRSRRLLISWLQSSSAVILEPKKIKSVTISIVSPSICHEVMGQDAISLIIRNFVSKVMSLLFNMLSRFVIAFLPRIKRLLSS